MDSSTTRLRRPASPPPADPFSPFGADWFRNLEATERRCRDYVEALRWPGGVSCPRCRSLAVTRLEARKRLHCRPCRYHFSLTSGTLFHGSHLPLWKWLLAVFLMLDSDEGLPANQLAEILGVTYRTAWFVEHRIRAAMGGGPCRHVTGVDGVEAMTGSVRLFERSLVGCYHQLSVKHLPAYVAESEWRARNRANPRGFRDTVLAMVAGDPLSYSQLTRTA